MNGLLLALAMLLLIGSPVVVHKGRQARFRRQCRQIMKAHRDTYQRFLIEHPKP